MGNYPEGFSLWTPRSVADMQKQVNHWTASCLAGSRDMHIIINARTSSHIKHYGACSGKNEKIS